MYTALNSSEAMVDIFIITLVLGVKLVSPLNILKYLTLGLQKLLGSKYSIISGATISSSLQSKNSTSSLIGPTKRGKFFKQETEKSNFSGFPFFV